MKHIVHVNQHRIRANRKSGDRAAVLTVKSYKSNRYTNLIILRDTLGNEVGRFVYSPDKPLSCGARVWFETAVLDVEVW